VCADCGLVLDDLVIFERMRGAVLPTRHSNYRRIHHAHERISQLLIQETPIPAADLVAIGECILEKQLKTLNKASVRGVLRSLSMQRYIERWLQIVQRLADAAPPRPGPQLLIQVDAVFQELQAPFEAMKPEGRKNFLSELPLLGFYEKGGMCISCPLAHVLTPSTSQIITTRSSVSSSSWAARSLAASSRSSSPKPSSRHSTQCGSASATTFAGPKSRLRLCRSLRSQSTPLRLQHA
jgi:hypothetical protein